MLVYSSRLSMWFKEVEEVVALDDPFRVAVRRSYYSCGNVVCVVLMHK